jgi:hypothetical protein
MGEKDSSGGRESVLTNRRRELVLSQLQTHETMSLRDLAEQIAVTDQQTDINSLCEEAIEEVEVALHHVHAPKLAEAGYVEYDTRTQLVSLTDAGRRADVDSECDGVQSPKTDRISVDLCPETVDRLHDVIRHDDRFDERMEYDEVIGTVLGDAGPETGRETEGEVR